MYYLQTRYYDPSIGQFISPDSPEYLDPETINGLSLYAYCNYNPVMNVDPTGTSLIIALFLIATTLVGAAIAGKQAYDKGKRGWDLVKDIILGAGIGLASGGVILMVSGVVVGAISGASATFFGVTAKALFSIGALAYNFTAFVIAPIYDFVMQAIDFEYNPYSPTVPNKNVPNPPHPAWR